MINLSPLRLLAAAVLFGAVAIAMPTVLEDATSAAGLAILAFFLSMPLFKWFKKTFVRPVIMFDVGGVLLSSPDKEIYDYAPIPGAFEMVARLRANYCVVVFSNNTPWVHNLFNSKFHFDQKFDYVFVSGFIKVKKPDAHAYAFVARKLGVKPSNIIFFDDTPANVAGAKAAGINAILYQSPQQAEKALREMGVKV